MKIQAEIFEGANYNGNYFECFKNPTSKEWDSVVKIDKVRGIILDNGDLYIWPSDISHDDATILFGVPDGIHIQVYSQASLGIFLIPGINLEYMYHAFTNTTSLYNYVNNNFRILELNTEYYHAEHDNRYYRIKTVDDIAIQYNNELVPATASKIKRLVKAEILSGANYKGGYFECFKNPTSKEWNEVSKASDNTRGILLKNGDLYIWSSEILHNTAINLFGIPDGIHIQTYNNYALSFHLIPETDLEYIYNAFKNTTSLYNFIDRDFDIVFIDTDTYGAKKDPRYENIKSMSDLEEQYNKEPITSKMKIQAEIFEGTNYEGKYLECFKNPTSKEWNELLKESGARGILLDSGELYIWPDNMLHDDAIISFGIPDGLHIVIHCKNILTIQMTPETDLEYMYYAFKNATSLYNYVNKNSDIVNIETRYYGAKENHRYENIKSINDIEIEYLNEPIEASKIKRLIKNKRYF